ncbi:hypothetical protein RN001_002189 [Aquatica leii]|uniref:DUF4806 domain-containing protein n=1 Tax=Aquatica leii TaxID=1421715 RepID=A0AAN7QNC6_9COLE|nr:hypothetical protein RN001_002189 [Aquatica leii]
MEEQNEPQSLYFVVEFPEEIDENGLVSMAVISSNWTIIENNVRYCMWSYYLKTDAMRTKAVVNHTDLDFTKCAKCEIIVKYKTSIYNVAVSKLKRLEDASSLSQSETENGPRKRHRKRNTLLLNSDCDKVSEQSSSEQTDDDSPVTPILRRTTAHVLQKNVDVQESAGSCSSSSRSFKPLSVSTPMARRQPISHAPTVSQSSSGRSAYAYSLVCLNCQQNSSLIQELLIKVEKMEQNLKYLVTMFQQQMGADLTIVNDGNNDLGLPITTVGDLTALNNRLEDVNELTKMCQFLQTAGGKDIQDTTRRVLSRIMSNNLAMLYNWSGRNDKTSFSSLKKLLIVAVRKNPFSKNATQQEIESVVKVWLRNASDRDGGRSRRKNATITA